VVGRWLIERNGHQVADADFRRRTVLRRAVGVSENPREREVRETEIVKKRGALYLRLVRFIKRGAVR
jgi:hypothetical protein